MTAPVLEEVLYRGFVLPALLHLMPLALALPASALLFALHHSSLHGLLPLTFLGLVWGGLYARSQNLLVPIAIHTLWNVRVFALTVLA